MQRVRRTPDSNLGRAMVARMSVAVLWQDGVQTHGKTATDILQQLRGGWNPNTVTELRDVLARRARVNAVDAQLLNDEEFLELLDCAGALTFQHLHD